MRTFALSRCLFVAVGSVALATLVVAGCGDDAGTPTAAPTRAGGAGTGSGATTAPTA